MKALVTPASDVTSYFHILKSTIVSVCKSLTKTMAI